jgi:hypothetical protein
MALTPSGKTGGADDRAPISHGITFSFLCRFLAGFMKNRDGYVGVEMEDVAGTCSSRIGSMAF